MAQPLTTPTAPASVRRRRPRDRRRQILEAASERFRQVGYYNVAMGDIAEDVGITAGALYRHFEGKQDLLVSVIEEALDSVRLVLAENDTAEEVIAGLTTFVLDRRAIAILWQREARHLPPVEQARMRRALRSSARIVSGAVQRDRRGLSLLDADLLAWGSISAVASPAHHHVEVERERFAATLSAAGVAVLRAELERSVATGGNSSPPDPRNPLMPASRREALVAAATRLFGERGYHAVAMTEIGAAAGVAGASVYNHFQSKSDVLVTALRRGHEALLMGLHRALGWARTPAQALDSLVTSYIDFAVHHPDVVAMVVTEQMSLPDEVREELRRAQRDYLAEWVELLRAERPELDHDAAWIVLHCALGVVNDLVRVRHLRRRPRLPADLVVLTKSVLNADV